MYGESVRPGGLVRIHRPNDFDDLFFRDGLGES